MNNRNFYKHIETGQVYEYDDGQVACGVVLPSLTRMEDSEVEAHIFAQTSGVFVPSKVTMRQARLALHSVGKLTAVESAINALPEPPRTAARIEWDYSSEVHRDKEFVAMMGQALNLSDEELDDLFTLAATL